MRKYVVSLVLVVAGLCWAGANMAYAADYTNDTYNMLFHVMNVCGRCANHCHDACKVDCQPKCEPCCKQETCTPPPCEPCCKQDTCTPPPCDSCHTRCCPQPVCEYPDPCRGSDDPFTRDGLSRKKAWF